MQLITVPCRRVIPANDWLCSSKTVLVQPHFYN